MVSAYNLDNKTDIIYLGESGGFRFQYEQYLNTHEVDDFGVQAYYPGTENCLIKHEHKE